MTTDRSSGGAGGPRRPSGRSSRPPRPRTIGASSSTSSNSRGARFDELVEAGRVGRPHGLDGSFHVHTRDPDLLADELTVAGVTRRVVRRAGTLGRPILRVEGVATRDEAEALRGEALLAERPALDPDEFWAEELVGCVVEGRGAVARLVELPSCEALELDDGTLVPLVRSAIASIDIAARWITLSDGFLEDAPGSADRGS